MGSDDYLAKPFEIEELLARMRTVMRRNAMKVLSRMNNFLIYGVRAWEKKERILKI